jgi:hypothetical protein
MCGIRLTHSIAAATGAVFFLILLGERLEAQVSDAMRSMLTKRITLEKGIAPYTQLDDAIGQLSRVSGANIVIDKKAFLGEEHEEIIGERTVQLPKLKDVEVDAVLRALLWHVGSVYEIRKDTLVVVPAKGRDWPTVPITEARTKREMEVRRKLDQKIILEKPLVADTPEQAVALLSKRFGVQIVSQLLYSDEVRIEPVKGVTLGSILERLLQKSPRDAERFHCVCEVFDNVVIVTERPITLGNLLTPQKTSDSDEAEAKTLPSDVEKQVQAILAAKDPHELGNGHFHSKRYRTLFRKVGPSGIRRLENHPNDGIALQAAWEAVALTVPEQSKHGVRPDSHRLAWFIGFVEGRLRLAVPRWWQEVLLDSYLHTRVILCPGEPSKNPYHRAGLGQSFCPRDTTMKREGNKIVLRVSEDSIPIPDDLLHKTDDGEVDSNISALFTKTQCYVAIHGDVGYTFKLVCIDRSSEKVRWKSDVWATFWGGGGFSGFPEEWVSIREQNGRVIVFGAAVTGIHVEGFRADNGKNLFRFSSSY